MAARLADTGVLVRVEMRLRGRSARGEGAGMITRATGRDGGEADATRAAALWRAYKANLSARADRLGDAPSQVLAGFRAWRELRVCGRTGREWREGD